VSQELASFKSKATAETKGLTSGKTGATTHESSKVKADSTETMIKRWLKIIQEHVPTIDLIDISHSVPEKGQIQ